MKESEKISFFQKEKFLIESRKFGNHIRQLFSFKKDEVTIGDIAYYVEFSINGTALCNMDFCKIIGYAEGYFEIEKVN